MRVVPLLCRYLFHQYHRSPNHSVQAFCRSASGKHFLLINVPKSDRAVGLSDLWNCHRHFLRDQTAPPSEVSARVRTVTIFSTSRAVLLFGGEYRHDLTPCTHPFDVEVSVILTHARTATWMTCVELALHVMKFVKLEYATPFPDYQPTNKYNKYV